MVRRDDDALSWEGDDDPTLDVGSPTPGTEATGPTRPAPSPATLPDGWSAVGKGSNAVAADAAAKDSASGSSASESPDAAHERAPALGNGALIATGVIGGVYLIYAIGWLIGGLRLQGLRTYLVTDVMYIGSLWLATLAPLIWFSTVWLLTRRSATWVRFVWLAVGLLLLLPWPFVLLGAVGQ
ncbi:DNA polymerase III subunit gamma/tau [Microbacterium sp. DT81.1]|uniref:DNA polymerase III subunit gamma/tau n=1 Tax=Microbacterium sp. DT81.1 TaxID=3393413 RepID=UPI003CF0FDF5